MTRRYKIAAFTLSEILVVLAITSIVIAIAFTTLRLITKQFVVMQDRYKERTEVTKFKQQLLFDVEKGFQVFWDEKLQQLDVLVKDETIRYEMTPAYVLRGRDTLDFKILNTEFYYKGDTVTEGIIDGIEIELEATGRPVRFFVSKTVDAQQEVLKIWE